MSMKKCFVVIVEDKPYVFTSKSTLKRVMEQLHLPFEPTVHVVDIVKRVYTKRSDGAGDS